VNVRRTSLVVNGGKSSSQVLEARIARGEGTKVSVFPDTRISLVVALSSDDPSLRARALDLVVSAYRAPVIAVLRRQWTQGTAPAGWLLVRGNRLHGSSGNTDHTDNTDNSGYFIGANPGRTLTWFLRIDDGASRVRTKAVIGVIRVVSVPSVFRFTAQS